MINQKSKRRHLNMWRGKTVTLMGLGVLGGGVEDAIFFIKNGVKKLIITDLKNKEELSSSIKKIEHASTTGRSKRPVVEWVLGRHREKDFIRTDLIIKNPAIPNNSKYLKIAINNNTKIDTSVGIFFELMNPQKIIGVTGTKGKSTTATLIYEVIKSKYPNSYITGIPRTSPLSFIDEKGWGVLELSSWRLDDIEIKRKSPHIAVITNIEQDHLNMHKSFREYVEAKKNIFKYQNKNDFLIINKNLKDITKRTRSKIILLHDTEKVNFAPIESLYPENINATLEIAKILKINKEKTLNIIKKFRGLRGRLELVSTLNGIKIYNDTTATNPFATLSALNKFQNKKISLIVGGEDKNLDYTQLSNALGKLHFVALLPGSASDKIYSWNIKHKTWNQNFKKVQNMKEALKKCLECKPDIILFSPAAASFNMFTNEFERGKEFNKTVNKLKTTTTTPNRTK